jgi:hypothetical protein
VSARSTSCVLALALALAGCAETECDIAVDAIVEKATDCSLPQAELIDENRDNSCDDDEVEQLERQADCTAAASCAALNGSDTAGNREFNECVLGP